MPQLPEDNPAPNAYYPRDFKRAEAAITVKSRYPLSEPKNYNPAPNAYDPYNRFTTKGQPAFSFAGRPDITKVDNGNPGPGYYELAESSIQRKNGVSMAGRYTKILRNDTPGPNYYYRQAVEFGKGRSAITIKFRPESSCANQNPGPGSYDIAAKAEKRHVSSSFSSHSGQQKTAAATPGPGSYQTEYSRFRPKSGRGPTFKGRYTSKVCVLEQ